MTIRSCYGKVWYVLAMLGALMLAPGARAESGAPLKLGILPFNSPLTLVKTHQPLATHLEHALGRKVQIVSSTDYFTHLNQLLSGEFDIAISAPHFGALAASKAYLPLFRYAADLQPTFVVRNDAGIQGVADFRGKRIGIPSRMAVISISGIKWLDEQGLRAKHDFIITEYLSHAAAIAAVAAGDEDIALAADSAWHQVAENIRAKTRLLPLDIRMPHLITLAHPRLGKSEIEQIRQALRGFGETAAGAAFFRETGYRGYAEITPADLTKMRHYTELTVKMMK